MGNLFCMLSYKALQLCENITNDIEVIEQTRVYGRNGYVQTVITPKVGKPESHFMCSA